MKIGDSVVIDAQVYEVLQIAPEGDLYVENVITLERKWVDYFVHEVINPHKDGGALLAALAALKDDEDDDKESDEETDQTDVGNELPALQLR